MRAAGVTLVELIVVLSILGLMLGVTALSVASLRVPAESERVRTLTRSRSEAIRAGKPVLIATDRGAVLFLPDGRGVGTGVDPLTGAVYVVP